MLDEETQKNVVFTSGLASSAKYVADMLSDKKVCAASKVIEVVDNNDIDREVFKFDADIVVLEGLWVVPEKYQILNHLHPNVKWVIRIHSEIPFLGNEGVAIDWISKCLKLYENVHISVNSPRAAKAFGKIFDPKKIAYLPNYFPTSKIEWHNKITNQTSNVINIGCLGAIRPLKNQVQQAFAAIQFANDMDLSLKFHINSRCEQGGKEALKNIQALFQSHYVACRHELITHSWKSKDDYLSLLAQLDLAMQFSWTETFNITSADTLTFGIPTVASKEVAFITPKYQADPTDIDDIVKALKTAYTKPYLNRYSYELLRMKSDHAYSVWKEYLNS